MSEGNPSSSGVISENYQAIVDGIADLLPLLGEASFYRAFTDYFRTFLPVKHTTLLEFRQGLQPLVLFLEEEGQDPDLSTYLSGLYLVDPVYDAYERDGETGIFLLSADNLDEFETSEGFKRYWTHTIGNAELACSYPITDSYCIHLSLSVQLENDEERARARDLMLSLEGICTSLLQAHVKATGQELAINEAGRRDLHAAVGEVLDSFGSDLLTEREQEVVQLVLKGHSAKSIARLLGISPGTVSIHRGNIYGKMGVSGKGELMSLFFSKLSQE